MYLLNSVCNVLVSVHGFGSVGAGIGFSYEYGYGMA